MQLAPCCSLLRTLLRVVGLAGGLSRIAAALASAAPEHLWLAKLFEGLLALSTAMHCLYTSTHNPPHSCLMAALNFSSYFLVLPCVSLSSSS